jgi:YfiR/HmsC-like
MSHVTSKARHRAGALALLLLATGLAAGALAQASANEYEVKAAFLLNFARLVEWPPSARPGPGEPMVFGVLGAADVASSVSHVLQGASVGDHPVVVKALSDASQVAGCHIVFIAGDEPGDADQAVLAAARGHAALSVGEHDGFAVRGGVINFYSEDKKLRFEINPQAADAAGLRISSRLLRLARLVN